MGKVYKARHRLLGRMVALKFISREYLTRPNALPRFLREMRLVGRLDHPHIVRALDAEEIGRDPCIVMEYVPGQDLERLLLGRGPLPPEDVAGYALQAALGLAHAHEQGVIHRDIKPSNVLLGEDGRVRILDLGLATLIDDRDADVSPIISHATAGPSARPITCRPSRRWRRTSSTAVATCTAWAASCTTC